MAPKRGRSYVVCTCGDWDCKTALPAQCELSGVPVPRWGRAWMNIKAPFQSCGYGKGGGMMSMLKKMGIEHTGRHHSGIDDCRNTAKILQRIIQDGHPLDDHFIVSNLARQGGR